MLEIYKGIKIEDEVIIVEKQNKEHQGYLVCKSNKNQLESALNWAKCSVHVLDKDGNEVKEQINGYTRYKFQEVEGIVHEYRNGQFTFSLSESAGGSSQGGKLSGLKYEYKEDRNIYYANREFWCELNTETFEYTIGNF